MHPEVSMWEKERKSVRVPAAEPISGSYTNGGAHTISGVTRDVSSCGTFFHSDIAPEVGSEIELLVTLPPEVAGEADAHALCRGRVVRIEPPADDGSVGVAVEFESVERIPKS
jgi:hypothetical protein